jgi:hypothetical protein
MGDLRRRWLPFAAVMLVAMLAIGGAAVLDHRHKTAVINRANVASWFCEHRGQRCAEQKPGPVEDGWRARERVYKVAFSTTAGLTVLLVLVPLAARRRLVQAEGGTQG